MGMFMGSIKNLADDHKTVTRWALCNLTNDDANDTVREKLSQCRIVGIGRKYVKVMRGSGQIFGMVAGYCDIEDKPE